MPAAGRERELSNDQMAAIALTVVAVTIVWAKRRLLATAIGGGLQQHGITLKPGQGLFTIPFFGGLDLPRVLVVVAVAGLVALTAALWLRPWLAQAPSARERSNKQQRPAGDELD